MKSKHIVFVVCMLACAMVFPVNGNLIPMTKINSSFSTDTADQMQASGREQIPVSIELSKNTVPASKSESLRGNYPIPEYMFITEPTPLMTSYYDYMPGSYNGYPLRRQTENGFGEYLLFHAQTTPTVNRKMYYAYVDENQTITAVGPVTSGGSREGYGGIDIHPATGDPIVTWHQNVEGPNEFETMIDVDDFDTTDTPGHWQTPFYFPDDPSEPGEYIWPLMYVGPSPCDGCVRVYQIATNSETTEHYLPCEDIQITYCDVNNTEGDLYANLTAVPWNQVNLFTDWREKSCRPLVTFSIDSNHPGRVAFIGAASWLEGDLGDMPVDEGLFAWESFDYGETWDVTNLHSDGPGATLYQVSNPGFEDVLSDVLDVNIFGYHNTAVFDSEGNLHWTFLQSYGFTEDETYYFLPMFLPQAEVVWNRSSQTFTFHEVPELPGYDALSGHSVPWINSTMYPTITWSTYEFDTMNIFQENTQKQAINTERNWLAHVWVDGTKSQLGANGDPNYADYIDHPIICISVSSDNGNTWSEPIQLTDINSELFDFSDQITVYPYVCDQIIDLGDNWGQLDLMYLDDNSFGSYVLGSGANTGGQITYCSIKIRFPVENHAPVTPGQVSGPTRGFMKTSYTYTTNTNDSEGDQVFYQWDWGDGTISDWLGPYESGAIANASHQWAFSVFHAGPSVPEVTFLVRVKAKDSLGAESDWSVPLTVRIRGIAPFEPDPIV